MPVLKTQFLKSGFKQPSSGAGASSLSSTMANSELDILEMKLQVNGFLSKAALDQLVEKAETLKSQFNANTQSGKNSIATMNTRIAGYHVDLKTLNDQKSHLASSEEDIENDLSVITSDYADNPVEYFKKQVERLDQALESVNHQYETSRDIGDTKSTNDYFAYYQKLKSQRDYFNKMLEMVGGEGKGDIGAFVTTDPQGNTLSVEYKLTANSKGFVQTNKDLDGISLWLKPTSSNGGVKRAVFGGQEFITEKVMGSTPQEILANQSGVSKLVSKSEAPLKKENFQIRTYIPQSGWALGKKGMYKHLGGNEYQLYGNVKPEDLGLKDGDYQKINSIWEDRINQSVVSGMSVDPALLREGVQQAPSNVFSGNDLSYLQSVAPKEEKFNFGADLNFQTKTSTQATAPREEKGGFVNTVKNIWGGIFGRGKEQQKAVPASNEELPSFVDKL